MARLRGLLPDLEVAAELPRRESGHLDEGPYAALELLGESQSALPTMPESTAAREEIGRPGAGWAAFAERFAWPIAEVLLVIYGPTPPNAQAPGGCPNGESGGNPGALNNGNYGLLQISAVHVGKLERVTGSRDLTLLFEPAVNIAVGWLVYAESGGGSWLPWSCRPGGK